MDLEAFLMDSVPDWMDSAPKRVLGALVVCIGLALVFPGWRLRAVYGPVWWLGILVDAWKGGCA